MPRLGAGRPSFAERAAALEASVEPVEIQWDCIDGFFHANWRRPHAYLDRRVRRGTSVWARLGPVIEQRAVNALAADLHSGAWHRRNAELIVLERRDLGARLIATGRA